jgi:hypothetical protein
VAFATLDELNAYTGLEFDPAQGVLLLDIATSVIEDYTGQRLQFVADDTITLAGNWSHLLTLPQRPVTAVTAVSIVDTPPTERVLVENQDYTWMRNGSLYRPRGYSLATERTFDIGIYANWGGPDREVQVTYSHGYPVVPVHVKGICLELCKRVLVNPGGLMREAIDGYMVAFDRGVPPGVSLEPSEMKRLDRIRRTSFTGRALS